MFEDEWQRFQLSISISFVCGVEYSVFCRLRRFLIFSNWLLMFEFLLCYPAYIIHNCVWVHVVYIWRHLVLKGCNCKSVYWFIDCLRVSVHWVIEFKMDENSTVVPLLESKDDVKAQLLVVWLVKLALRILMWVTFVLWLGIVFVFPAGTSGFVGKLIVTTEATPYGITGLELG